MSLFGPTLQDLAELWESQEPMFEYTTHTYSPAPSMVRSCCCVGYLTNPGGKCCMDMPRGETVVSDKITISPTPQPAPAASGWRCPGCGTYYGPSVQKCECDKYIKLPGGV